LHSSHAGAAVGSYLQQRTKIVRQLVSIDSRNVLGHEALVERHGLLGRGREQVTGRQRLVGDHERDAAGVRRKVAALGPVVAHQARGRSGLFDQITRLGGILGSWWRHDHSVERANDAILAPNVVVRTEQLRIDDLA